MPLPKCFVRLKRQPSLRQSPIRFKVAFEKLVDSTLSVSRRSRKSSVPCRVQAFFSNLMVVNQPLVAHGMGSKDVYGAVKLDGTGSNQDTGCTNAHAGSPPHPFVI